MKEQIMADILTAYPFVTDFFDSHRLDVTQNLDWTLAQYMDSITTTAWEERALTPETLMTQLADYMEAMMDFYEIAPPFTLQSLTILPGTNKQGQPEGFEAITLKPSQVIAIVGPTGSGKSRLLADIEWTANGDTQTGRRILINGQTPDLSWRYAYTNQLVAQLSQNMNFVIDATVSEFLEMHAECRNVPQKEAVIEKIIAQANALAGEPFDQDTNVTALSGGQSRALMIADTAILSPSPIVLIDEIENAGIDRKKAIEVFLAQDKIVLMATHDPLLCLMADLRIVIQNGGIDKLITTSQEEKIFLETLWEMDGIVSDARQKLRQGQCLTMA